MSEKLRYSGIDNYGYVKGKKIVKVYPIILGVIFCSLIMIVGKLFLREIDYSDLSYDKISYYIDITDKVSEGKVQVNWQEVAAINEVLNSGKEDELVSKIAEVFLKNSDNGGYTLFTVNEVLEKLNVKNEEKEKVKAFLSGIQDNTLYKDLYKDEVKIAFINEIYPAALENYKNYGILPSITLAQAILESGWGESELAVEHNNIFGIKADSRWDGAVATMTTKENYDYVIEANFRKYDSILQSIEDHGEFLYENERYRVNGLFDGKEYKSQAQSLEDAGYSTAEDENGDKIYADKLINVIQKYNLMIFDSKVKGGL